MRPGFGTVNLIPETPLSITKQVTDLIEGVGCHIVITKVQMETPLGDAAMLAGALCPPQRVVARPSRTQIDFTGPSSWRDTYMETAITKTAGTPTQWLTDLLGNGLSVGTVTGGSNVTHSLPAYGQTYRQALDLSAEMGGWEYDVQSDFTVDAGAYTNLFQSPPKVVITNRAEGDDGTYTGLLGSIPGPNIDASNAATKVVAVGQGDGQAVAFGSATHSIALKDQDGNTPTLVQVINAPTQTSTGAGTVATNVLPAFTSTVKSITVTTTPRQAQLGVKQPLGGSNLGSGGPGPRVGTQPPTTGGYKRLSDTVARLALGRTGNRRGFSQQTSESQFVRSKLRPGDEVYVYDLEAGILDTANQITYRGETISPAKVRCTLMTWPLERGLGVYVRSNAATPTYIDLTPFVQWEAPGTQIDVSDWTPASYGAANRSNPLVETRVKGAAGPNTYTPTQTNFSVGSTAATNVANYTYDNGVLTVEYLGIFGTSGVTLPGSTIQISLPPGFEIDDNLATHRPVGECSFFDTSATARYPGWVTAWTATTVRFWPINAAGTYAVLADTSTTVPFAWAVGGDAISATFSCRAVAV